MILGGIEALLNPTLTLFWHLLYLRNMSVIYSTIVDLKKILSTFFQFWGNIASLILISRNPSNKMKSAMSRNIKKFSKMTTKVRNLAAKFSAKKIWHLVPWVNHNLSTVERVQRNLTGVRAAPDQIKESRPKTTIQGKKMDLIEIRAKGLLLQRYHEKLAFGS